ncbi:MAG: hypothetical protein HY681_03080 [Chloroflexi bacterium]|nr:hypothetical protein [Chloroflexota bacterium]
MKKRYLAIVAGVLALSFALVSTALAGDGIRLEAGLSGGGAEGKGTWRLLDDGAARISVEVADLQLAGLMAGDQMSVSACGASIGTITLVEVLPGMIGGDLNLDARLGDMVVTCHAGDVVTVSGTAVTLSGSFDQSVR